MNLYEVLSTDDNNDDDTKNTRILTSGGTTDLPLSPFRVDMVFLSVFLQGPCRLGKSHHLYLKTFHDDDNDDV